MSGDEEQAFVSRREEPDPFGPERSGQKPEYLAQQSQQFVKANDVQNYYVSGDAYVLQQSAPGAARPRADEDELSTSRRSFLFEFYGQALKQAEITFRLSIVFMSVGAVILLLGGFLAILNAGAAGRDYAALVSSLSGVIITVCGGAFALHANRARKHLTSQAEKMERELRSDRQLDHALQLIDEVGDPELRDRIKSLTAMRALDFESSADVVTKHLLMGEADEELNRPDGRR